MQSKRLRDLLQFVVTHPGNRYFCKYHSGIWYLRIGG